MVGDIVEITFLAAAAVLGLGIGSAYADGGVGPARSPKQLRMAVQRPLFTAVSWHDSYQAGRTSL